MKFNEILIEISQNCNLSCIMCGFGRENNSPEKFMPFEQFKIIFDQIKGLSNVVRINGRGESTIHPQFKKILRYAGDCGVRISLFTNASFCNPEIIKLFELYEVQLFISIDATKKELIEQIRRGVNFEQIESNLRELKKLKTRPFIVFTLQELNINEIGPIAQFSLEHECNLIFNVVRRDQGIESFKNLVEQNKIYLEKEFGVAKEMLEKSSLICQIPDQIAGVIINEKKATTCGSKNVCPALSQELCVYYNGDVGPCNMFNPYFYGNLFENTLLEIWNGEKRREFMISHKSFYYCKNCACLMEDK